MFFTFFPPSQTIFNNSQLSLQKIKPLFTWRTGCIYWVQNNSIFHLTLTFRVVLLALKYPLSFGNPSNSPIVFNNEYSGHKGRNCQFRHRQEFRLKIAVDLCEFANTLTWILLFAQRSRNESKNTATNQPKEKPAIHS